MHRQRPKRICETDSWIGLEGDEFSFVEAWLERRTQTLGTSVSLATLPLRIKTGQTNWCLSDLFHEGQKLPFPAKLRPRPISSYPAPSARDDTLHHLCQSIPAKSCSGPVSSYPASSARNNPFDLSCQRHRRSILGRQHSRFLHAV